VKGEDAAKFKDIITRTLDLTNLQWQEGSFTSGTGGTFLKARAKHSRGLWYYKLSNYDAYRGIFGHECVNEIIASRLMNLLGVAHVPYQLVHARVSINSAEHETWLVRSESFRTPEQSKVAFDTFCALHAHEGELPLEVAQRFGWEEQIYQMFVVDYLIANRDRHGANLEVLQDRFGTWSLAPLFDNGVSLLFSSYGDLERAAAEDPLRDFPANNHFGTKSLEENLSFVPEHLALGRLHETDKESLLAGLDRACNQQLLDLIWNMIWKRWCHYETLCHS